MASDVAERFMKALQKAEDTHEVDELADIFADDATLKSIAQTHEDMGRNGAESFWQEYLKVFRKVHSEFNHVTEQDGRSVLEWVSEGELNNGEPVRYEGVSVLETQDGKVHRFCTYYDSAVFLPQATKKS